MKKTPKTLLISIIIAAMLASCSVEETVAPAEPSDQSSSVIENEASLSQSESEDPSQESSEGSSEETSSEVSSEASSESSSAGSEISSSESSSASSSESSSESSSQEPEKPDPKKTPYSENGVTLSQTAVTQGRFMKIRVEGRSLAGYWFTDFYGRTRNFFEFEGAWYTFIPIDTADEPGVYNLVIDFGDYKFEKEIEVIDRKFPKQYLEVKPETLEQTIENEAARTEFAKFVQDYLGYYSGSALWGGKFKYPLGEMGYSETTRFGSFRTFSNGSTEWHNAIDMAVSGGTPIYATNAGYVIFASHLGVSGNTVVIDHGAGILSWHYHLRDIFVLPGTYVSKGDQIGTVGTTGLSTGNHLHFGVSVGGIFTDPAQFMGKQVRLDF